jgi:hypothetical protein
MSLGRKIMMDLRKTLTIAVSLFAISGTAQAVLIDFKGLADGGLGESAWSPLMFRADGTHTTSLSDAFLEITATNGSSSYAYLDSRNAGLGVCGELIAASNANQVFPNSTTNLCNPSSDDNISYHNGTSETVHFMFDEDVTIDNIWLNNNHDGDKSLLDDYVLLGTGGGTSQQLANGGRLLDSLFSPGLTLLEGTSFDVGFDPTNCGNYNNCELYISKIEFSRKEFPPPSSFGEVPEPTVFALLALGLASMSYQRRKQVITS